MTQEATVGPKITSRDLDRNLNIVANSAVETVRPWHPSFSDFLRDSTRSQHLSVEMQIIHEQLAMSCLEIMEKGLRRDICQVEALRLRDRDVPDMRKRVEENVPRELGYACAHWASHLPRVQPNEEVRLSKY